MHRYSSLHDAMKALNAAGQYYSLNDMVIHPSKDPNVKKYHDAKYRFSANFMSSSFLIVQSWLKLWHCHSLCGNLLHIPRANFFLTKVCLLM
ncbi:unnamed protein product [Thlaspi arvense]|uniref:Uncharacterized protein n=1 Tax=Thlaspi arvense TaxID=13288 RepID=A0AAU9RL04_THLAR|nr:unnamed protein product [Thlaspi arvense]